MMVSPPRRATGAIRVAPALAAHGWAVFPIHWPVPTEGALRCSCGRIDCPSPAKHPLPANGCKAATTDQNVIAGWLRRYPVANLALATGRVSGVDVVDIDPACGGGASLKALHERYGHFDTLTARTGSGGLHFYFQHASGMRNSARRIGPGVDVRADGGYVAAAPTQHITGGFYAWCNKGCPIAPWPAWLREMATPPILVAPPSSLACGGVPRGLALLAAKGCREGNRDNLGLWLGCRLLQECGDRADALEVLRIYAAACTPPLSEADVRRIWRSAKARQSYAPTSGAARLVDILTGEVSTGAAVRFAPDGWQPSVPFGA